MMKRKAITERMKIDALLGMALSAYFSEHGWYGPPPIYCLECKRVIEPGEKIEWDHRQATVHGGPHNYMNIRPVHVDCHKAKTKRDVQANAKVKRCDGTRAAKFAVNKKPLDDPHIKERRFGNSTFRRVT